MYKQHVYPVLHLVLILAVGACCVCTSDRIVSSCRVFSLYQYQTTPSSRSPASILVCGRYLPRRIPSKPISRPPRPVLHTLVVWLRTIVRRCISPGFGLSHMCVPRPTSLGDLVDGVPALLVCRRHVVICGVLAERGGSRVVLPIGSIGSRILTVSRHWLHRRIHIWPTFLLSSIFAAVGDPILKHVPTRSSSRESLDRRPRGVRRSDRGCLLDLKLVLQPSHLGL